MKTLHLFTSLRPWCVLCSSLNKASIPCVHRVSRVNPVTMHSLRIFKSLRPWCRHYSTPVHTAHSIESKSCYEAFFCVLNGRGLRHKSHMKANYSTWTSLNLVGNVTEFCYKMIYSFAIWKKEVQKSRWKIIFTSNSLHLSTQQYFTCAAKLNTHFETKTPHDQKSNWAALWMYTQGSSWSVTDPEGFISLKYYPLKDFSHPSR